jgi:hypothetical protein
VVYDVASFMYPPPLPATSFYTFRTPFPSTGRFRYIACRAERRRFARNSAWAFNLAPAFPRGALTLCPQLCICISPRRYTEIGILNGIL